MVKINVKKFLSRPSDFVYPLCNQCKHLDRIAKNATCAAYPEGIPDEILGNKVDHHKPYKGDHGIQFEPMDENAVY